jgi:branched-chain amino acid transport system permease protein
MDSSYVFLLGSGLARGAVFALFALSLVLIWRATRVANFAQGAMAVVSTYVAFFVTSATGNYWLGLVAAIVSGALLGFVVERGVMRFVPLHSELNPVIVAIGLVMVIQGVLGILFGSAYQPMKIPFSREPLVVGGVPLFSPYVVFVFVVVAVLMVGLALLFTRSSVGLALRAAAFDPEVSRLNGVRVGRMRTLGWVLSAAVGGLAALLVIPTELGLNPHATDLLFVYAFTVAIVGGLDSPVGAVVGGLAVGLVLTFVTAFAGSTVAPIAILVLLVVVLLVRPRGIFSARAARSA